MIDIKYLYRKIRERKNLFKGTGKAKAIQKKMNLALLKNDVLNKPHVFRIELVNTLNCNAKCAHCSNHQLCEDSKNIKPEIVERVLEEAIKNKTPSITFLGGESLTDKNIFKYLEMFANAEMGVALSTNSLLVNKEVIKRLKEIGVTGFGTTIYDADPEKHDEVIGIKGTFDKIKNVISLAKKIGLNFTLSTVYTKEIAGNGALERMKKFAFENNKSLKVNLVVPVGGSASEDLMLDKNEIDNIKNEILSDSRLSTHCIFNSACERCPMGRTYVGILPEGEMLPCYFMPLSMGNIRETSFQEYLDYTQSFSIFRKEGLPKGYCLVAESKSFFKQILEPLYKSGRKLPVDLREDKELEEKIRNFEFNEDE